MMILMAIKIQIGGHQLYDQIAQAGENETATDANVNAKAVRRDQRPGVGRDDGQKRSGSEITFRDAAASLRRPPDRSASVRRTISSAASHLLIAQCTLAASKILVPLPIINKS